MILGTENHEKSFKIESIFDLSFGTDFSGEVHQNLVKNGPKIDPNSIKNWFEKSMHFWTTPDRIPGTVQRQMLRQRGVGGDQF
jgi:hypothetical protein